MANKVTETRNRELVIRRHMDGGWQELTAVVTADVTTDGTGAESVSNLVYSVADHPDIALTDEEKELLNATLGISQADWDKEDDESEEYDEVEEIDEDDFDDANPPDPDEDGEDGPDDPKKAPF